jgi:UDP:flavonoid glycosyltransferase YjiC (YdhE family)
MARFLTYTSPARGHLYPIAATLLELRRRGHEVHVRTLAAEVAALQALGLHAEPIAPAIERLELDDFDWDTPEEALAGGLRTFGTRSVHEMPDLRRAIADVDPTSCWSMSRRWAPPQLRRQARSPGRSGSRSSSTTPSFRMAPPS